MTVRKSRAAHEIRQVKTKGFLPEEKVLFPTSIYHTI